MRGPELRSMTSCCLDSGGNAHSVPAEAVVTSSKPERRPVKMSKGRESESHHSTAVMLVGTVSASTE